MDMKQMLEEFDEAYNQAFNRGDAAGCAAFFTEESEPSVVEVFHSEFSDFYQEKYSRLAQSLIPVIKNVHENVAC